MLLKNLLGNQDCRRVSTDIQQVRPGVEFVAYNGRNAFERLFICRKRSISQAQSISDDVLSRRRDYDR